MFKAEITLPCFAKINLSLRVLGRRVDGYHEIVTLLQTVSLRDDLHLAAREDEQILLTCLAPAVPTDETNLILRAARKLSARYHVRRGAAIFLEKRIPVFGGLGGASANAAMTLLGLVRLWELDLSLAELIEIGSELGADVPFFFFGGRALATGTGTEIRPVADGAPLELLIVTPNRGVSTAAAYAALNASALTTPDPTSILTGSFVEEFLTDSDQWPLRNDFESVIFEKEPEVFRVQKALLRAGAERVLLAGSGSSVFGIFDCVEAQQRALGKIQAEAGWRTFSCRTLPRDEYVRALGPCAPLLLRSL